MDTVWRLGGSYRGLRASSARARSMAMASTSGQMALAIVVLGAGTIWKALETTWTRTGTVFLGSGWHRSCMAEVKALGQTAVATQASTFGTRRMGSAHSHGRTAVAMRASFTRVFSMGEDGCEWRTAARKDLMP